MLAAISQSRYLPALNYLQRIYFVDKFVLLDDVQHQRRSFEHRNRYLVNGQIKWLSIPINRISNSFPIIHDMQIDISKDWTRDHINKLKTAYGKSKHYSSELIDFLYKDIVNETHFSTIAKIQLERTFEFLKLPLDSDKLLNSEFYEVNMPGAKKLFEICKEINADTYVSGPNGRNYIKEDDKPSNLKILYHDFDFPKYEQINSQSFDPWMNWLDAYFNAGEKFIVDTITSKPILRDK